MSIDAFGYQVMSLRELIEQLQARADLEPHLLDMPVWTGNMSPLHFPVKRLETKPGYGISLVFERGGN